MRKTNQSKRLRSQVVAFALMTMAANGAFAQTVGPTPVAPATAPAGSLEEVTITGTRLRGTDAESANPISVVTSQDIAQTEATTIEQYFRKMPAIDFTNGVTAGDEDVGLGASYAGLRNLGPQRTLILVNGQRFPFTDNQGTFDAVDLNNIPVPMIDSIVVLRDGASSVYGADAVGGVINIITKTHFEGLAVDSDVGESTHGDALKYGVSLTAGSDLRDDRGNVLVNIGYDRQEPVLGAARAWAISEHPEAGVNAFPQISSNVVGATGVIGGQRWFFPSGLNSGILGANANTLGTTPFDNLGDGVVTGGKLPPGDLAIPGQGVYFNYGPGTSLISGLERKQINLTMNYKLAPTVTAVLEGFYTNRQSTEQSNPTQTGAGTPTPTFPNGFFSPGFVPGGSCNPNNPTCGATSAAQAAINSQYGITGPQDVPILTRRTELGDRLFSDDINTYRLRASLQGTIFNTYSFEVGFIYGLSTAIYRQQNDTNFLHMAQELGMVACGPEAGCSLANFFGYNTLTPEQAAYLAFTNTDSSRYQMSLAYGNIGGRLFDLPAGPVKGVVGFERRSDSMFENPDTVVAAGDALTFSSPTSGSYYTTSGYVEVNVPLLKDVPLVKSLTTDVSGRYDDNTTFGSARTYKIGLDWAVNDDFRFRGTHSTGFRAPQVKELFGGHFLTQPGGFDPCAVGGGFAGNARCDAAIIAAGGNPATVQQINQINVISGGNPSLQPETSRQSTAGIVFTPRAIPSLSVTFDYYSILVMGEVSSLDPNAVLADCYGNVPYVISQTQACAAIGPRLEGTGDLGNITLLNNNVFDERTNGIDFHLGYGIDTKDMKMPAWGRLVFTADANYLLSDEISGAGATIQQAGTFSNDYGRPRVKAATNFTFVARDKWSASWTTRYYGGLRNADPTSACQYGAVPSPCGSDPFNFEGNETGGIFYHDISAAYQNGSITVTIGVDNLFDKDPPFLTPNADLNTMGAAGYDFVGRFIYMKAQAKF
jgi:iron complex outermembrane recepter protein